MYRENERVKESMSRIGYGEDWSLSKSFVLRSEELKSFACMGDLNTDSLPHLEYRAPRSLYNKNAGRKLRKVLYEYRAPESFPPIGVMERDKIRASKILREWGMALASRKMLAQAKGALANAVALNPLDDVSHSRLGYRPKCFVLRAAVLGSRFRPPCILLQWPHSRQSRATYSIQRRTPQPRYGLLEFCGF
jgi:hypothetical protein